jgi:hypothetical protein
MTTVVMIFVVVGGSGRSASGPTMSRTAMGQGYARPSDADGQAVSVTDPSKHFCANITPARLIWSCYCLSRWHVLVVPPARLPACPSVEFEVVVRRAALSRESKPRRDSFIVGFSSKPTDGIALVVIGEAEVGSRHLGNRFSLAACLFPCRVACGQHSCHWCGCRRERWCRRSLLDRPRGCRRQDTAIITITSTSTSSPCRSRVSVAIDPIAIDDDVIVCRGRHRRRRRRRAPEAGTGVRHAGCSCWLE